MTESISKVSRPAVVIGLDGTPFSFLKKEISEGNLPNLQRIFASGDFKRINSEIPAVSSVAWASFMTGKNPAEHGIFGFTERKPDTYELYFPNYSHLQVETFWDNLSHAGKRCCILNVPSTYPARPLNGVLVSGFVAPALDRAVYPLEELDYLKNSGYRIDVDAAKGRESLDLLLEDLYETTERRREALFHYWKAEPWDLFICVFTGTDRLHHFMWKHYDEGDPVYAKEFMRFYQRLDEIIGEFVSELPEVSLFMLSDHGFCSLKKEVYVNRLLVEKGLLKLNKEDAITIADMDPAASSVYCLDPGRIYINLKGREPAGIVSPGPEYQELLAALTKWLLELQDPENGEKIISSVKTREQLFAGPRVDSAPDLVAVPHRGYDLKGAIGRKEAYSYGNFSGMHTDDDAFMFCSQEAGLDGVESIRDASAALLSQMEQ